LLQIERPAKIENAYNQDNQQRKSDSKLDQGSRLLCLKSSEVQPKQSTGFALSRHAF
jgi:hypothetical protein